MELRCVLSHKNQVIMECDQKLYAFNYNKKIAVYNMDEKIMEVFKDSIETNENIRFYECFKRYVETGKWIYRKDVDNYKIV